MENDTNAVPIEDKSLMDDLASAWDAMEEDNGAEPEGGSIYEPDSEPSRAAGGSEPGGVDNGGTPADGTGVHGRDDSPDAVNQLAEEGEKPPVGLSPEAREAWGETPDAVKQHIQQYEQRMEGMAQKYGRDAQRAQQMDKVLQPFGQLFAMNGGPQNVMPGLLQTASLLQMGSPAQKAQQVAEIIKQFGVDIKTLDNMLVGEGVPPEVQQQSQMEQMLNQRLQPLQQQLQGYQQREQMQYQQAQQEVAREVQDFGAQHEFYNDVKSDMADLLDMAANRGRQMTMEEAYQTACAAHPQISKIMAGRQSAESVQKKRQAASSIHGSSGGDLSSAAPNSVAAALQDAWDNAGRM